MFECRKCGKEFEVESINEFSLSGNNLNIQCPECQMSQWYSQETIAEQLNMSVDEVRSYRDELKEDVEESEEKSESTTSMYEEVKTPTQVLEEVAERYGLNKDAIKHLKRKSDLRNGFHPTDLANKLNNYTKGFLGIDSKDLIQDFIEDYQYGLAEQKEKAEGKEETYPLPFSFEMRGKEGGKGRGREEEDLSDLHPELREMVEERKEEKRRKQFGLDRMDKLEKQQQMILQALKNQGGGSEGGSEGKSEREQIFYDGLKLRAMQELREAGLEGGGNPISEMYGSVADVSKKMIEEMAPGLTQFADMITNSQKTINALALERIGLDPREILGGRRAYDWNKIQEKRREDQEAKEEGVEKETPREEKRDLREIMKEQQNE